MPENNEHLEFLDPNRHKDFLSQFKIKPTTNIMSEVKKPEQIKIFSDVTDEELKDMFAIVFKRKFPDTGEIRFYKASGKELDRKLLWSGVDRFAFSVDGYHWADCDLGEWRYDQHAITVYLISKGYIYAQAATQDAAPLEGGDMRGEESPWKRSEVSNNENEYAKKIALAFASFIANLNYEHGHFEPVSSIQYWNEVPDFHHGDDGPDIITTHELFLKFANTNPGLFTATPSAQPGGVWVKVEGENDLLNPDNDNMR